MKRAFPAALRALVSFLVAFSLVAFGAPAAQAADDPCAAQLAVLDQIQGQIDVHNAKPHVFVIPEQEAELAAYDAEADQLNAAKAEARSNLQTCADTLGALADQDRSSAPLKPPSDYQRDKIDNLKKQIPSNFQPYTAPDGEGYWRVPPKARPLYKALRQDNPGRNLGSPDLQGEPMPKVGDPDPFFGAPDPVYGPYGTIGARSSLNPTEPAVTADHIVPLAEMINIPGFMDLTADNMYMITRAPLNFQWMSQEANFAKSSRDVELMEDADPAWVDQQVALHDRVRGQLEEIIQKLLASQH